MVTKGLSISKKYEDSDRLAFGSEKKDARLVMRILLNVLKRIPQHSIIIVIIIIINIININMKRLLL